MYPVLTYSRDLGDFTYNLAELHRQGLKAIRLIYKGKSENEFTLRVTEIQKKLVTEKLDLDILIDLPGSKPIVGLLENGISIEAGREYRLINAETSPKLTFIPTIGIFNHNNFADIKPNDIISIADDELNLLVIDVNATFIQCKALNNFFLKSNRSISVKNKAFPFEANSEKDFLLVQRWKSEYNNVKFLVSFTRKAGELHRLKCLQPNMDFIPKIETILGNDVLLEIAAYCKTLLLGRGDLSTSSHPNELFLFQKHLIDLCKQNNKMLIVGTGLLTSIGDHKSPAISEIADYGYLRNMGVEGFLIAGSNAHNNPFSTLSFMNEFG